MDQSAQIRRLLRPKSVAVVGGQMAAAVVRQLDKIGFQGDIWPVHPVRPDLAGYPCFGSIAALPAPPDAAFIAVPREATVQVVAELAASGAGAAVCHASGFAEVGDEGQLLTEQLLQAKGDLALVGPNCWGILNLLDRVALWPDDHGAKVVASGVAIVAQSGNIAISLTMQQRALPIAYMISTGNQVDLTIPDYIEALLQDERVTAIGLHIEGLEDVAAFSRAALLALDKGVPLVVMKTGRSELGRLLTLSHTSSLAGQDELFDALFSRYGVTRAGSLPQFLEALKLLATLGPLPDQEIASISCSGGEAAIMADQAAELGLVFPAVASQQIQALHDVLGDRVTIANPLDYHTYIWGDENRLYRCFLAMLRGTQSVTISVLDFPIPGLCDLTAWEASVRAFARAVLTSGRRGIVVATLPENMPLNFAEQLLAQGIAPMMGLDDCLWSVRAAYRWGQAIAQRRTLKPLRRFNGVVSQREAFSLDEAQSKALLQKFDIPIPKGRVVTQGTAAAAAAELGFPLVAKILSVEIAHKSDVGGVYVGLNDAAALADVLAELGRLGDRFLLEREAAPPAVELIVGLTRDDQFGVALVIGAGGIWVELLADSVLLLFPVEREMIRPALMRLKIWPLLAGFRGAEPVAIEALIDTIMRVAQMAESMGDRLAEVDINPLFVSAAGVVAVDALIRCYRDAESNSARE